MRVGALIVRSRLIVITSLFALSGSLVLEAQSLSFSTQPASITAISGESAQLSASVAGGSGNYTYQWLGNGEPIPGATGATLPLNSLTLADARDYAVIVDDGISTLTSQGARVTVFPAHTLTAVRPRPGFNPVFENSGGRVNAIQLLPDGRAYLGGAFSRFSGRLQDDIARLATDGSHDTSFTPPPIVGAVESLAVQADGKLLVGGSFSFVGGQAHSGLVRLNPDGSLDASFNVTIPVSFFGVSAIVVQSDGKIVVAGAFTQVQGVNRLRIARLNADGTLDETFTAEITGGTPYALALQDDGKILVGGSLTAVNNTSRSGLARLNSNGSLDTGFNSGTGFQAFSSVQAIGVQPDQAIVVGGSFRAFEGVTVAQLVRLNPNGSRDLAFAPPTDAFANGQIYALRIHTDGSIVVSGFFQKSLGAVADAVARVAANGTIDPTFDSGATAREGGSLAWPVAVGVLADGRVLAGGSFTTYAGLPRDGVARLQTDGSIDAGFAPAIRTTGAVFEVVPATGGKWIAAGQFQFVNDVARPGLTRLNSDGTLDPTFDPGTGFDGPASEFVGLPDGKVLVGGNFTTYNGVTANRIVRLSADGSLDQTFSSGTGFDKAVSSLAVLADGRIMVAGLFGTYNGTVRNTLARLDADGALDTAFDPGTGLTIFGGFLFDPPAMVARPDGRVVVCASFDTYNGAARSRIAQIMPDGTNDGGFDPGNGSFIDSITFPKLLLQSDGRVIVKGGFGNAAFVRLDTDGSVDSSFAPSGYQFSGTFSGMGPLQADDAFFIGGTLFPSIPPDAQGIRRILPTGDVDPTFISASLIAGSDVLSTAFDDQGNLLIAGVRTDFSDFTGRGLVLLESTDVPVITSAISASAVINQPFTYAISATGDPTSYAATSLPVGLMVNPSTGIISGTPTMAGNSDVNVSASNTSGTGNAVLNLTVKNIAVVSITDTDQTYDGGAKSVTVTTTPTGLSVSVTYEGSPTPPITAESYDVVATITDPNYSGSATGTLTIAKATQSITFNAPPPMAATAAPFAVAATATSGLPITFSVVSGPATITGDIVTVTGAGTVMLRATQAGNFNYHADQVDRSFIVSKAPASVSLSVVAFVFDGSPKDATATTMPAGLAVDFTYDGSSITPLNAGTYDLLATINEPNYTGSAAGTLTINPAPAGLVIGGTARPFDGAPKPVTITTTPVGLTTSVTYNGSTTVPSQIGTYDVIVTVEEANYTGSATATLVIAPGINPGQSGPLVVSDGGETTLTVSSAGIDPAATFQWQIEVPISGPSQVGPSATQWIDISNATNASYRIASTQRFNDGRYRVVITTNGVSVVSLPFTVTVASSPTNDARLLNLSTRAQALTGDDVLIPGFVVAGTGTKKLLIRAVGPTLGKAPFNLTGVLADPTMRLLKRNPITNAFEEIATNDNWGSNANAAAITQTAADVFAFGLDDALESALLMDLAPGEYTAIARGVNNVTGLAIVELYDADTGTPTARLANISNRGFAGVGDQVMIPGFVVSSEGPKTLLVRVVGPTLGSFGVANTMADPKLEVFPSGSNTPILTNDNWGDNPDAANTAAVAAQVFAFPLTAGSADAAFVVTLPPGGYTVVGSSAVSDSTGVVLVEVYVVP